MIIQGEEGWPVKTMLIELEDVVEMAKETPYQTLYTPDKYVRINGGVLKVFNESGEEIREIISAPDSIVLNLGRYWSISGHFCLCTIFDDLHKMLAGVVLVDIDTGEVFSTVVEAALMGENAWSYGVKNGVFLVSAAFTLFRFEIVDGKVSELRRTTTNKIMGIADGWEDWIVVMEEYQNVLGAKVVYKNTLEDGRTLFETPMNPHYNTITPVMLTPSLLFVRDFSRDRSFLYNFITQNLVKRHTPVIISAVSTSIDGRYLLGNKFEDGNLYGFSEMSPDGTRVVEHWDEDDFVYREFTLKKPLIYPVYTHIRYGHRWIRLMSDLTLETHDTHPGTFLVITSLRQAISKAKERAPGGELDLPIRVWAYNMLRPDPFTTFDKAKLAYLSSLITALSKEIIKK